MDTDILDRARRQSSMCKLFGNPNRVLILWVLAEQEHSVGEIASAIESSPQNTSQHLRLMQAQGVVESCRKGNSIYYRLVRESICECSFLSVTETQLQLLNEGAKRNDEC